MAKKYTSKKLIVEGNQDKRVIPYLIEANGITWGETRKTAVVDIESYGSDQFIDADVISTELKASGLTALGLMVDADDDLNARWDSDGIVLEKLVFLVFLIYLNNCQNQG